MKKITLLVLLVGYYSVFAQKVNLKWGPVLEEPRNSSLNGIIGQVGNSMYTLRIKSGDFYLESYDLNTLNMTYSKEMEIPETPETKKNDYSLERCLMLNKKIYVYASTYDRKADTKTAVVFEVNTANAALSSTFKVIDEIKDLKKGRYGTFDFSMSEDSTKILVYHSTRVGKNENEKYAAKLYDSNFKLIWQKDFETKEANRDVVMYGFDIDKDGTFYQLVKLAEKEVEKNTTPDYRYVINAYIPSSDEMRVFDLRIGEKFITDINFEIAKDGNLVCAGFYSDRNKNAKGRGMDARYDRASGVFYMKIDKATKEVKASQLKEFDKQVMLASMRNKKRAGKEDDVNDYDIRDFVFKDDGSMYMIAEQYRLVVSTYTDSKGGTHTTYTYLYNNLMVASFDADGKVNWTRIINKYQVSANDGGFYSSFANIVVGDKLYFIYNDDKDNIDLKDESERETMRNPKTALTMLSVLDKDGNVKTSALFNAREMETICRPKISYQDKDGEAIIFTERKRDYSFGRISVQ